MISERSNRLRRASTTEGNFRFLVEESENMTGNNGINKFIRNNVRKHPMLPCSHSLNTAKHKSLIDAPVPIVCHRSGWMGVSASWFKCIACKNGFDFSSLWGKRKEKCATLQGEGELHLFTILETSWNLQLQTGTKKQLKLSTDNSCEIQQEKEVDLEMSLLSYHRLGLD